jgi:hypothetical protein
MSARAKGRSWLGEGTGTLQSSVACVIRRFAMGSPRPEHHEYQRYETRDCVFKSPCLESNWFRSNSADLRPRDLCTNQRLLTAVSVRWDLVGMAAVQTTAIAEAVVTCAGPLDAGPSAKGRPPS